jgi:hypothetical protein
MAGAQSVAFIHLPFSIFYSLRRVVGPREAVDSEEWKVESEEQGQRMENREWKVENG